MTRIVDGAPFEPVKACRCGAPLDAIKYIGPQRTVVPGDWLLLGHCNACRTSIVMDGVNDACLCCVCGHLILGDHEDQKTCFIDAGGRSRVACGDCAPKLGLMRALDPDEFRVRRFPITIGEVRQQQTGATP